ncbi:hypothetical protein, partial [Escherichia coli]|uniref:hypothetical protein n=1 Tax=Escherichia coli TaxID=562 RepID=UPI003EE2135A
VTFTGSGCAVVSDAPVFCCEPEYVLFLRAKYSSFVISVAPAANISQPDADKLLAASRGEFIEGISDPNDPKWVKGIQTRDTV